MSSIASLWTSADPVAWSRALDLYWNYVLPRNVELEQEFDNLNVERLKLMSSEEWYQFLEKEYFRWKYTEPRRFRSTSKQLKRYVADGALSSLDTIRQRLLNIDPVNVKLAIETAKEIRGLGTAGATGLLALMYPSYFATVDQFLVKALLQIKDLEEIEEISLMKPESLSVKDGVLLVSILRRKCRELNREFGVNTWTPRKLDKILWALGHESRSMSVGTPHQLSNASAAL